MFNAEMVQCWTSFLCIIGNMLAIALLVPDEEDGSVHSASIAEWVKNIADNFRPSYASSFTFGFIKRQPHLFTDITLDKVTFPTIFVLDPPTDRYFLPSKPVSSLLCP